MLNEECENRCANLESIYNFKIDYQLRDRQDDQPEKCSIYYNAYFSVHPEDYGWNIMDWCAVDEECREITLSQVDDAWSGPAMYRHLDRVAKSTAAEHLESKIN